MVQVLKQDATIVVHGSSRYNNNSHDEVTVHTTIITDSELTEQYYVPAGVSLNNAALNLIKSEGLEFRPYRATELLAGTENIQESAKTGDAVDTVRDSARLILLSALKMMPLTKTTQIGNKFVYELRYDYKIFPQADGSYQFEIRLPFDGTQMGAGSQVNLTCLTPYGATVNTVDTKGIAENGQEIQEQVQQLRTTNRMAVEFHYQVDPLFTVKYTHTQPLLQA